MPKNIGYIMLLVSVAYLLIILSVSLARGFLSSVKEYRYIKNRGYAQVHTEGRRSKKNIYHGDMTRKAKRKRAISTETRTMLNELSEPEVQKEEISVIEDEDIEDESLPEYMIERVSINRLSGDLVSGDEPLSYDPKNASNNIRSDETGVLQEKEDTMTGVLEGARHDGTEVLPQMDGGLSAQNVDDATGLLDDRRDGTDILELLRRNGTELLGSDSRESTDVLHRREGSGLLETGNVPLTDLLDVFSQLPRPTTNV